MPARRSILLGGILLGGAAILVLAQAARAELPPPTEPSLEPARAIVENILRSRQENQPLDLSRWPLVPRIRAALAKADIEPDALFAPPGETGFRFSIEAPTRPGDKQARIEARIETPPGKARLTFDLDRTSGAWLITDIRHENGTSLRQMLQIPAPR